ncbi:CPCC family cysteine-rich protein [Xenorhabdus stockiae]|uniref:CPCC family cysteine-rich protein n=1 Tax=Xenorhabdus stockiae TaxID=351614 RepID=UPI004064A66B
MNMIKRKSAIIIFSIYKIALLSKLEIENILFADYLDAESGEPIDYNDIYDDEVQTFLIEYFEKYIFFGVSNEYLKLFLEKCFNKNFIVIGDETKLEKCPCCCYLTLIERGQYDVCPVCQWEDDGTLENELDLCSSVNHSSLRDYRLANLGKLAEEDIYYRKG